MADDADRSGTKRLLVVASDVRVFTHLRAPLIAEAIRRRHKVTCWSESIDSAAQAEITGLGAEVMAQAWTPVGYNPLAAYRLRQGVAGVLAAVKPHTIAPCDPAALQAVMAASVRAGVPRRVPLLARLGLEGDAAMPADRALSKPLETASAIVVEAIEDARAARRANWLPRGCDVVALPAAGIDPVRTPASPLPDLSGGFVFLLVSPASDAVARATFEQAMVRVARRAPAARFAFAGTPASPMQSSVATGQANAILSATPETAHVCIHAGVDDGLVPGLLEALAAGRAVITTDVAGCRDTVDERVNGCRVPTGDPVALAEAMLSCLKRPDLLVAMGRASRVKAERRFDIGDINRATLDVLGLGSSFAVAA